MKNNRNLAIQEAKKILKNVFLEEINKYLKKLIKEKIIDSSDTISDAIKKIKKEQQNKNGD
jgi:hypothetical protein